MSYASSSSSSDSLSDHSIFDPFGTLTGTTFDPFTSSFSSSHCNSPPTSFTSPIADYDDQYSAFKRNTDSFIQTLLKGKREQEVALRAWRVRCDALESEVLRLSGLVLQLETEKKALEVQKKEVKPVVVEQVQTRQPRHSHTSPPPSVASTRCDCSPDCVAPTPCRWTGATWEPLPAPTRPTIDPTKPMSRQNPPPCNAFYLIGHCDVPRCRFEHQYELTVDQVAEMRRGALHHVCNAVRNGVECPDGEDCIYGHFCPRGPACGRERCGFNDEQHRIIPAPRPVVRRR